jgi:hypothetical protein
MELDVWDAGSSGGAPSRSIAAGPAGANNDAFITSDGTIYYSYYFTGSSGSVTCAAGDTCVAYAVVPPGRSTAEKTYYETIVPQSQQVNFGPDYMAVGPDGTLYVTENTEIQDDTLAGLYVYKPNGTESYVATPADPSNAIQPYSAVQGIDVDGSGNVYVASDNQAVSLSTYQWDNIDTLHTLSVYTSQATMLLRSTNAFQLPVTVAVTRDGTAFVSGYPGAPGPYPFGEDWVVAPGTTNVTQIPNLYAAPDVIFYTASSGHGRATFAIGAASGHSSGKLAFPWRRL